MITLVLFLVLAGLLAFGGFVALLEWYSRKRTRKVEPLLGVVLPREEEKE